MLLIRNLCCAVLCLIANRAIPEVSSGSHLPEGGYEGSCDVRNRSQRHQQLNNVGKQLKSQLVDLRGHAVCHAQLQLLTTLNNLAEQVKQLHCLHSPAIHACSTAKLASLCASLHASDMNAGIDSTEHHVAWLACVLLQSHAQPSN